MTKQAKSDEEIRAMAKSYRGDGATADELAAHEVGFRQAEEMYLHIINQLEKDLERCRDAYFKEFNEIENILGKATGNVVTQEIKDAIGGKIGNGFFGGYAPIEVATLVARHINQQAEEIEKLNRTIADYKEYHLDQRRLARELDVIISGKNAAEQCSLIDLFGDIKKLVETKSRFDELVKRLEGAVIPMVNIEETGGPGGYYLEYEKYQYILTKAKG